jgi:diguanylate cyclase (GGDEF)-like protein
MDQVHDVLDLLEDDAEDAAREHDSWPWRIAVIDDDSDVHEATEYSLANTRILGHSLQLLHAHSAQEAIALLQRESDIAVILLDVVMESEDAGLRLVELIRSDLGLDNVRIILRTGQPGHAPEIETISRFDINDYKTKSELVYNKLYAALTTAIRSYDQLRRLDASRRGLEHIVAASNQFIAEQGLMEFAEGVITQIASMIDIEPEGIVCARSSDAAGGVDYRIIAAAGRYRSLIQHQLAEIGDAQIIARLSEAMEQRRSQYAPNSLTLYFPKTEHEGFAAYIAAPMSLRAVDHHLLEVFCTNIALCANNVDLVAQLRRDAQFDRLLGLPNRNALIRYTEALLLPASLRGFVLAVIDIDHFSDANDSLGYAYGDDLLKAISSRLCSHFHEDVFVARISTDVFGIVGSDDVITPDNVHACFRAPFSIQDIAHQVSVCIGLTPLVPGRASADDCLKEAHIALKRAKSNGIGQAITFTSDIGNESRERFRLLRELRIAFDRNQLFLAYQPQVDLQSRGIVGIEALLRWRKDDGELVPPDRFISIAEHSGLIVDIGRWILRTALATLSRIRAAGHPQLRLAVNVSPVELRNAGYFDMVAAALHEAGISGTLLELEVTESATIDDIQGISQLLARLRSIGITIAIDDFGTGYSSLSYLERLPADRLKIDRSFISMLGSDNQGERITRMIVPLGRSLGLTLVAEGVEGEQQASLLADLGCDQAQGFAFARPMPEDELQQWLATRAGRS